MAGRGPAPKPAHLRQRKNYKHGSAMLEAPERPRVLKIPNPDGREWHELTLKAWKNAWASPMASQWLDTDVDAMGRLALLWDELYKGDTKAMAEIRLQEQRFGLSPLDRSRLQWEVNRAEEADRRKPKPAAVVRRTGTDPRGILMPVP